MLQLLELRCLCAMGFATKKDRFGCDIQMTTLRPCCPGETHWVWKTTSVGVKRSHLFPLFSHNHRLNRFRLGSFSWNNGVHVNVLRYIHVKGSRTHGHRCHRESCHSRSNALKTHTSSRSAWVIDHHCQASGSKLSLHRVKKLEKNTKAPDATATPWQTTIKIYANGPNKQDVSTSKRDLVDVQVLWHSGHARTQRWTTSPTQICVILDASPGTRNPDTRLNQESNWHELWSCTSGGSRSLEYGQTQAPNKTVKCHASKRSKGRANSKHIYTRSCVECTILPFFILSSVM